MFYYLNKNTVIQLIAAVGLAVWAIISIITQMQILPPDHQAFLYQATYPLFASNPWIYKTLAILLTLLSVLMIQTFFSISKFAESTTYMPIVFFLLLLNLNKSFLLFSPVFFTFATTSLVLVLNAENEHGNPISHRLFSCGLIIGINTLFDYNSIWLMALLVLIIIITRIAKFKEILILLTGFIFIYLYLFTYGFLSDSTPIITEGFHQMTYFNIIHHASSIPWLDWLMIGVLGLTLIAFSFSGKVYFDNKIVALRRRYVFCILLTITSVIICIFSPFELPTALPYVLMPTSILFSIASLMEQRNWIHTVFIVASCVLLWL